MTIYRFDQIADNIRIPVMPGDTDLDRYVGLEHLDPESLKLRRWGSPDDVIGQKLHFWKGDIIYGKRRRQKQAYQAHGIERYVGFIAHCR
jgi:type I restriction enzyme S subunit